ncbi:peptidoglycan-binding protein [Streptomyces sp. NPDC056534]|uniref:peptidoglycan-binding protein n=1 Tax=Streptomyces sp. NPDC056534 TaxID=3345857 RepID=UPI0036D1A2DD
MVTAPVEHRVLTDSVILRGTVTAGQTVPITPTAAGEEGAKPIVTRLPVQAGARVVAGQVVLEVSGRPVFVLKGELPAYRDLRPGTAGKDVKQLQQALSGLGHAVGSDSPGTFGAGTKEALDSFYASIGYKPTPASLDSAGGIEAAAEGVVAAERALEDVSGGSETGPDARKNVDRAKEDLSKARRELAKLKAADGPMLPAAEVFYLRDFPARVSHITATMGSAPSGTALTLSSGELVVHGYLQDRQKDLIRAGQKARVLSEVTGDDMEATVVSVGSSPQAADNKQVGEGEDSSAVGQEDGYLMVVRPKHPMTSSLAGQDVRITVEAASTVTKALVVPVSAVSASADGTSVVTVVEKNGIQRRVPIKTGTSGDGFIAITPVAANALHEGYDVVVGVGAADRESGGKE